MRAGGFGRRLSPALEAERSQRKALNGFSLSSEATAEDRYGRMSCFPLIVRQRLVEANHHAKTPVDERSGRFAGAAVNRRCHGLFLHREKADSQEFRQASDRVACSLTVGKADQFLRAVFAGGCATGKVQNPAAAGSLAVELTDVNPLR